MVITYFRDFFYFSFKQLNFFKLYFNMLTSLKFLLNFNSIKELCSFFNLIKR
jgi:hypothetical protein